MIADQAQAPFGLEALAVEGDDARRLLAAMLERVQAECRQRRGVGVAIDAEDAAFLAQPVGVQFEDRCRCSLAVALSECRLLRVAARVPRGGFPAPDCRCSCSRCRRAVPAAALRPAGPDSSGERCSYSVSAISGGMNARRPSPVDLIIGRLIGVPHPRLLLVEGQQPAVEQIGDGHEDETPDHAEDEAQRAVEGAGGRNRPRSPKSSR